MKYKVNMEYTASYELGFNPRSPRQPLHRRLVGKYLELRTGLQATLLYFFLFSLVTTLFVFAQIIWDVLVNFWPWMLLITVLMAIGWAIFVFAIKFRVAFAVKERDPVVRQLRRGTRGAMRRINRGRFGVPTNLTHAAEVLARHGLKGDRALNEIENRLYRICSTDGVQVFGGVGDTEMLVWYRYPDPNPKKKEAKEDPEEKDKKCKEKKKNKEKRSDPNRSLEDWRSALESNWSETASSTGGSTVHNDSDDEEDREPDSRVLNVMVARGYVEAAMGYILDKSNLEEFADRWVGRDNTVHVFSHLVGRGVLLGPRSQWWRRVKKAVASVLGLDWARPEL